MLFFSGNDLKVLEVAAQREYKNPVSGGRSITINIYVADGDGNIYDIEVQCSSGANVHRASFYSSMRCRKADNDPIGKLAHGFRWLSSVDMFYPELAKQVKYFKETEGGREIMCQVLEDLAEKRANERAEEVR